MLVNKVVTAGRLATSGGMAACPNTTAGMAPYRYTNNSAGSDGSETWYRKTSAQATIKAMVMTGVI